MTNAPTIQTRDAQPYAAITIEVPMRQWGRVNALIPEVFGWLAEREIQPAGPMLYRHRVCGDMDVPFHVEVGVPMPAPIAGTGRIVAGEIPAGRYATLLHTGHPDRLRTAIAELDAWGSEQGLQWDNRVEDGDEVWGGRFEFYLTDPAVEPDPEKWSIEVAYLLR